MYCKVLFAAVVVIIACFLSENNVNAAVAAAAAATSARLPDYGPQLRAFSNRIEMTDSFSMALRVDIVPYHHLISPHYAMELAQRDPGSRWLHESVDPFVGPQHGQNIISKQLHLIKDSSSVRKRLMERAYEALNDNQLMPLVPPHYDSDLAHGYLMLRISTAATEFPPLCRKYVPSAYSAYTVNSRADPHIGWLLYTHPATLIFRGAAAAATNNSNTEHQFVSVFEVALSVGSFGRELIDILCVVVDPRAALKNDGILDLSNQNAAAASSNLAGTYSTTTSRILRVHKRRPAGRAVKGDTEMELGNEVTWAKVHKPRTFHHFQAEEGAYCDRYINLCFNSTGNLHVDAEITYPMQHLAASKHPKRVLAAATATKTAPLHVMHKKWLYDVLKLQNAHISSKHADRIPKLSWSLQKQYTDTTTTTATSTSTEQPIATTELWMGSSTFAEKARALYITSGVSAAVIWADAASTELGIGQVAAILILVFFVMCRMDITQRNDPVMRVTAHGIDTHLAVLHCIQPFYTSIERDHLRERFYRMSRNHLVVDPLIYVMVIAGMITAAATGNLSGPTLDSNSFALEQDPLIVMATTLSSVQIVFYSVLVAVFVINGWVLFGSISRAYMFEVAFAKRTLHRYGMSTARVDRNDFSQTDFSFLNSLLKTWWQWMLRTTLILAESFAFCRRYDIGEELALKISEDNHYHEDADDSDDDSNSDDELDKRIDRGTLFENGLIDKATDYLVPVMCLRMSGYILAAFAAVLFFDWNIIDTFHWTCIALILGALCLYLAYHFWECLVVLLTAISTGSVTGMSFPLYTAYVGVIFGTLWPFTMIDVILPLLSAVGSGIYTAAELNSTAWVGFEVFFGLLLLAVIYDHYCFHQWILRQKKLEKPTNADD